MAYVLVRIADEADWRAYHDIRRLVLWEERGLSSYDEARPEERLPDHHPLLLRFNARACGTTRLEDLRDGTSIVRLVAISAALRGQGHGRVLDARVADYAGKLGIRTLFVNAVADAVGFYAATGWARFKGYRPQALERADECVPMRKVIVR
jgi:N-acetylglutamate synthase-like GNAT family acetyltransferase